MHRHLKFSHVLGQTSVNSSNTIRPATNRNSNSRDGNQIMWSTTLNYTYKRTWNTIDSDIKEDSWKWHSGSWILNRAQQVLASDTHAQKLISSTVCFKALIWLVGSQIINLTLRSGWTSINKDSSRPAGGYIISASSELFLLESSWLSIKVERMKWVPPDQQRIIFAGKQLDDIQDSYALIDYNIQVTQPCISCAN